MSAPGRIAAPTAPKKTDRGPLRAKGMTQTRFVCERLREQILSCRLLPGAKLNIAAIAEELYVSPGAVREALAMLQSEAFVVSEPQRGYRVSPISERGLMHLVEARIQVESLCLTESIRHGDVEWESRIAAAWHRLSRVRERDDHGLLNERWIEAHAEFHRSLMAACPNEWLLRLREMLYHQSERYRRLTAPLVRAKRNVEAEHRALSEAVLERDVAKALRLLQAHLQTTARILLNSPLLATDRG